MGQTVVTEEKAERMLALRNAIEAAYSNTKLLAAEHVILVQCIERATGR